MKVVKKIKNGVNDKTKYNKREFLQNLLYNEFSYDQFEIFIKKFFKYEYFIEEKRIHNFNFHRVSKYYDNKDKKIEILIFRKYDLNNSILLLNNYMITNNIDAVIIIENSVNATWKLGFYERNSWKNRCNRLYYFEMGKDENNIYLYNEFINIRKINYNYIKNIFSINKFEQNYINNLKKNIKNFNIIYDNIDINQFKQEIIMIIALYFLKIDNRDEEILNLLKSLGSKYNIDDRSLNLLKKLLDSYSYINRENLNIVEKLQINPSILEKLYEDLLDNDFKKNCGIYYTPKDITKYMCNEALLHYIKRKKIGINEENLKKIIDGSYFKENKTNNCNLNILSLIKKEILNIKIIDPALGCGAFLLEVLYKIYELMKNIILLNKDDNINFYQIKLDIIENCIYGVDINKHSIYISKLRIFIFLVQGIDLTNKNVFNELLKIKYNLYTGDTIIPNRISGFNCHDNFKNVFENKNGFDIIIGNPPYLGEKGNKSLFNEISLSSIGTRFYQGKSDLFYFFFHIGLDLLNKNGILAYITTNYYVTADGAFNLRKDIKTRSKIIKLVNFGNVKIFDYAKGQTNLITILSKSKEENLIGESIVINEKISLFELEYLYLDSSYKSNLSKIDSESFFYGDKLYIKFEDNKIDRILDKLLIDCFYIKDYFNVSQGIVSGADRLTNKYIKKYKINGIQNEGIFVVEDYCNLEKEILWDLYKNSDICKYNINNRIKNKIIYTDKSTDIDKYPKIKEHLLKYKEILSDKRESRIGQLPWYSLNWSRKKDIFLSEKIVAPQRSKRNTFAYNNKALFASADIYYITKKDIFEKDILIKYVLAILNSKLYYFWLYYRGKKKGKLLELYGTPLENTPIKKININEQKKYVEVVDKIIKLKEIGKNTDKLEQEIDMMVYSLYNLSEKEIKEVEFKYSRV